MADYHPLIARAVAGLEKNTGEARRALYERARTALVAQLRGVVPPLDESEITRERLALEEAIRKVEAEAARQAREMARPAFARRAEPLRREDTAAAQREAGPHEDVPPAAPSAQAAEAESAAEPQASPAEPGAAEPRRPPAAAAGEPGLTGESVPSSPRPAPAHSLSEEALKGFREVISQPRPPIQTRRPELRGQPQGPPTGAAPAERHPLQDYGQLEPQVQPENLWTVPVDASQGAAEVRRGRADRRAPPEEPEEPPPLRPRSYAGLIRLLLVLVAIGALGGLAYWQRQTIADFASAVTAWMRPSTPAPPREAAPAQRKITDRLGQPTPQTQTGLPVAQRVVLYEEDPVDPQGKRYVGNVVWRIDSKAVAAGRPPEIAVRGDIEVPERKLTMTWSLRRNTDQSLPASHTIEIVFNLPQDSPEGGVQNVPGVLMKQAEQTRGIPLAGLAVKVTPGYFLIGLSALENDVQRNLQLLKERSWFDIPIVYNNNKRAILAMEKGTPGEKAFADAFAAWKQ